MNHLFPILTLGLDYNVILLFTYGTRHEGGEEEVEGAAVTCSSLTVTRDGDATIVSPVRVTT